MDVRVALRVPRRRMDVQGPKVLPPLRIKARAAVDKVLLIPENDDATASDLQAPSIDLEQIPGIQCTYLEGKLVLLVGGELGEVHAAHVRA